MRRTKEHPHLYIIAGPNGAGKTTFARKFLPYYIKCKEFVNADLIAAGLSPFSPEAAALQSGKLLLEQIHKFAGRGNSFGFETTLSGVTYLSLLHRLKSEGYLIHLYFLWIPNVEMALERIADRVRRGGHDIPEKVVRRRFYRGLHNLFKLYDPFLDSWFLLDNSEDSPRLIALKDKKNLTIVQQDLFDKISKEVDKR